MISTLDVWSGMTIGLHTEEYNETMNVDKWRGPMDYRDVYYALLDGKKVTNPSFDGDYWVLIDGVLCWSLIGPVNGIDVIDYTYRKDWMVVEEQEILYRRFYKLK